MNYLACVINCFMDHPSGSARVAWDTALVMRDQGHNVALATVRQAGDESSPTFCERDHVRILRYRQPALSRWSPRRMSRHLAAAAEAIRRHFGGETWDLAHIHAPLPGAGMMRALGDGPAYVYTMHSPVALEQSINWPNEGLAGRVKLALGLSRLVRLERRLLGRSSRIQALSQYTRSAIARLHGLEDRVTVLPHWRRSELKRRHSKPQARRLLGWPEDEKILLTLRRHVARMGINVAIEAIAPLAADGRCIFVIAGQGPLTEALQAQARQAGADDARIRFVGRLSEEELALAYEAADLFVLPTLALECFGIITIEAMSFGCPVMGTDAGATPEILDPIAPELVVPAGDAAALRGKVEAVLAGSIELPSPEALEQYVSDHYGKDVIVPKLLDFLQP